MFEHMAYEDYIAVTRPEVAGTWNLHNALIPHSLDFFVLFGSITSIVGNRSQAAYSATTTFVDAFASYRASLGLVANTIDLGAVVDFGLLADQTELRKRAEQVLGTDIKENELLALVDAAISGQIGKQTNYHALAGLEYHGRHPDVLGI